MGAASIAAIVAGLFSAVGVVVTALMARKSQSEANTAVAANTFREDFVTLVGELKSRVDWLEGKNEILEADVERCEAARREDRGRYEGVMREQADKIHILEAKVAELGG